MATVENPENTITESPLPENEKPAGYLRWLFLLFAVVAVVAIVLFAQPFITILYNIVVPPRPALPQNLIETSHINYDYGVDEWLYTVDEHPCAVLDFYQQQGVVCQVTPLQCNRSETTSQEFSIASGLVARCTGETDFSLFSMDWWILIMQNADDVNKTNLDVWREVNWISSNPVNSSTPTSNE